MTIITAAILIPIATGEIGLRDLLEAFKSHPTPLEDKTATSPPQKTATQPIGDLKASNKSRRPISPVAIGIRIAAVMIVTPILIY